MLYLIREKPKHIGHKMERVRTICAVIAAVGTLYLVLLNTIFLLAR